MAFEPGILMWHPQRCDINNTQGQANMKTIEYQNWNYLYFQVPPSSHSTPMVKFRSRATEEISTPNKLSTN